MPFPPNVKEQALVAAQRSCCICHAFCGVKIECHHIVPEAEGGKNDFENCIPLCLNCHADVKHYNPQHPKGTKYGKSELKAHREKWFAKVSNIQSPETFAETSAVDREVFNDLRKLLPSDGAIRSRRGLNYDGLNWDKKLKQLEAFVSWASLPKNQFLDADLDSLTAQLVKLIWDLHLAVTNLELERSQVEVEGLSAWSRRSHSEAIRGLLEQIGTLQTHMEEVYFSLLKTGRRKFTIR